MSKTYFTSKVEPADAALRLGRFDDELLDDLRNKSAQKNSRRELLHGGC